MILLLNGGVDEPPSRLAALATRVLPICLYQAPTWKKNELIFKSFKCANWPPKHGNGTLLALKRLQTGDFCSKRPISTVFLRIESRSGQYPALGHLGALKTPSMSVDAKVLGIMLHLPSS